MKGFFFSSTGGCQPPGEWWLRAIIVDVTGYVARVRRPSLRWWPEATTPVSCITPVSYITPVSFDGDYFGI